MIITDVWFLFWGLGALIGLAAAQKRGFHIAAGLIGGFLLGPFAVLMFLVSGVASKRDGKKKCPFCANMIKQEARVCQYCHRDLPEVPIAAAAPPAPKPSVSRAPKVVIYVLLGVTVLGLLFIVSRFIISPGATTEGPSQTDRRPETTENEIAALVEGLFDPDRRQSSYLRLRALGPKAKRGAPDMVELLTHSDQQVQTHAMSILQAMVPDSNLILLQLASLLEDERGQVYALSVLETLGPGGAPAVPGLVRLATDAREHPSTREQANEALVAIRGFPAGPPRFPVVDSGIPQGDRTVDSSARINRPTYWVVYASGRKVEVREPPVERGDQVCFKLQDTRDTACVPKSVIDSPATVAANEGT